MKSYYIYILTNFTNTVLYIGVTNDIIRRVWQHKQDVVPGFTSRYHVHKLIYYEVYSDVREALKREKQIKAWPRKDKIILISKMNPDFIDLYDQICT